PLLHHLHLLRDRARVRLADVAHAHPHPPVAPLLQLVQRRRALAHHEQVAAPAGVVLDADPVILHDRDPPVHLGQPARAVSPPHDAPPAPHPPHRERPRPQFLRRSLALAREEGRGEAAPPPRPGARARGGVRQTPTYPPACPRTPS